MAVRATLAGIKEKLDDGTIPAKGEFVIVVEGSEKGQSEGHKIDMNQLLMELATVMPGGQAAAIASTNAPWATFDRLLTAPTLPPAPIDRGSRPSGVRPPVD